MHAQGTNNGYLSLSQVSQHADVDKSIF